MSTPPGVYSRLAIVFCAQICKNAFELRTWASQSRFSGLGLAFQARPGPIRSMNIFRSNHSTDANIVTSACGQVKEIMQYNPYSNIKL